MTAYPTVTFCARPECGRTETMHKIRTDGWSRSGTDDGVCAGFQPGQVEERAPEEELRRRLDAVLALHEPVAPYEARRDDVYCAHCSTAIDPDLGARFRVTSGSLRPHPCPTVRAARGET